MSFVPTELLKGAFARPFAIKLGYNKFELMLVYKDKGTYKMKHQLLLMTTDFDTIMRLRDTVADYIARHGFLVDEKAASRELSKAYNGAI